MGVDSRPLSHLLQTPVYIVAGIAVGIQFHRAPLADYGEQVVAAVFRVLVEKDLHLICPCDDQLLAGLVAPVGHATVPEVALLQERHIYEAHPAQVETHHEHIPREIESRTARQVQHPDCPHRSQRQRPLHGPVNAGIYLAEGIAVHDYVILHRTVIDRPEDSGVK